jgi:hypothetical protein
VVLELVVVLKVIEDLEELIVDCFVELDELLVTGLLELVDIEGLDVALVVMSVWIEVTVLVVVLVTVERQEDADEHWEVDL